MVSTWAGLALLPPFPSTELLVSVCSAALALLLTAGRAIAASASAGALAPSGSRMASHPPKKEIRFRSSEASPVYPVAVGLPSGVGLNTFGPCDTPCDT